MHHKYDDIRGLLQENYLVFKALGDKQRQEVLFHLNDTERISVGELAKKMTLSRPAVSHHIKILKEAGLLTEQKHGVRRYYTPNLLPSVVAMKALTEKVIAIESDIK